MYSDATAGRRSTTPPGGALLYGLSLGHATRRLEGVPPLSVLLGDASGVTIEVGGRRSHSRRFVRGRSHRLVPDCRRRHACLPRRGRTEVELTVEIQPIRGMNDVLPAQIGAWQRLEGCTRELLAAYGYEEIRVPVRGAHRALQARDRRIHRRRREGDVHLHRPGRRQPDPASGGDCRHRARADLERHAARPAPQAVVHGSDVPPRAAAEGPLPAVQPDQRGGGRLRRSRRRCGADRPDARASGAGSASSGCGSRSIPWARRNRGAPTGRS